MVFEGKVDKEIYNERRKWLPWIQDVFLPLCDSEHGDFLHYPYGGSLLEQPYVTMQVLRLIQLNYKQVLHKQMEEAMKKR